MYLYDHSGIRMSTTSFSCRWDSGQVGFIVLDRKQLLKTHGTKRISKKQKIQLIADLISEVKTYDQYLTGDVYGYIIEDEEGDHVDSCWGFYGEEFAEQEGQSMLNYYNEQEKAA